MSYDKNINNNSEYNEEITSKQNLDRVINSKYNNNIKLINKQKILPLIN